MAFFEKLRKKKRYRSFVEFHFKITVASWPKTLQNRSKSASEKNGWPGPKRPETYRES
jgi:aryl carrier-like protein